MLTVANSSDYGLGIDGSSCRVAWSSGATPAGYSVTSPVVTTPATPAASDLLLHQHRDRT